MGGVLSVPALIVRLSLESTTPEIYADACNKDERSRLRHWINVQPELREIVRMAEALRDADNFEPDPGEHLVPGGEHQGESLRDVAALGVEGERWFVGMLARLSEDDWMRGPIEEFVREQLPDLWTRYTRWLRTKVAA